MSSTQWDEFSCSGRLREGTMLAGDFTSAKYSTNEKAADERLPIVVCVRFCDGG